MELLDILINLPFYLIILNINIKTKEIIDVNKKYFGFLNIRGIKLIITIKLPTIIFCANNSIILNLV